MTRHEAFDLLAATTVEHLPGDIAQRVDVLTALLTFIPAAHRRDAALRELLRHLNEHQIQQMEFLLPAPEASRNQGSNGGAAR